MPCNAVRAVSLPLSSCHHEQRRLGSVGCWQELRVGCCAELRQGVQAWALQGAVVECPVIAADYAYWPSPIRDWVGAPWGLPLAAASFLRSWFSAGNMDSVACRHGAPRLPTRAWTIGTSLDHVYEHHQTRHQDLIQRLQAKRSQIRLPQS